MSSNCLNSPTNGPYVSPGSRLASTEIATYCESENPKLTNVWAGPRQCFENGVTMNQTLSSLFRSYVRSA